jgi:hypothetical protein
VRRYPPLIVAFVLSCALATVAIALDGQPLLAATDATFPSAGRITLCTTTTADSVTRFVRLELEPLP